MKPDVAIAIATDRLDLEPLVVAHARELFDRLRDPALYAFIDEAPPTSLAALETRYRALERRGPPDGRAEVWLNWACRERATGVVAGLMQATVMPEQPERPALVAYVFTAGGQGRGLAREACDAVVRALFRDWRQTAVEATVHPDNARSIALLHALGFARIPSSTTDLHFRCAADSSSPS